MSEHYRPRCLTARKPRKSKPPSSPYLGVSYFKSADRWRATFQGKHLGYFDTAEEAARAYDAKKRELFPNEKLSLNFPEEVSHA